MLHTKRERKMQEDYDHDYVWYDQIDANNESESDIDTPSEALAKLQRNYEKIVNDESTDSDDSDNDRFGETKEGFNNFARSMIKQIADNHARKEEHVKSRRDALLLLFKSV